MKKTEDLFPDSPALDELLLNDYNDGKLTKEQLQSNINIQIGSLIYKLNKWNDLAKQIN